MHAITRGVPRLLREISYLKDWYEVKGSVGQGNIAEIPHICIFDRDITLSAERGYYIVFLFDSTMSHVFLSLNQGWTQYKKEFKSEAKKVLKKTTKKIKTFVHAANGFSTDNISLQTKKGLGTGYELGNICSKSYIKGQIPEAEVIAQDLKSLIGIYRNLKTIIGKSTINILLSHDEDHFQNEIQSPPEHRLPPGPIEKPQRKETIGSSWERDKNPSAEALYNASHMCELDNQHNTFISAKSGLMYVEAHHLIPMEFQEEFDFSIDVPENIIALCPLCHRKFHHAKSEIKNKLIETFLEQRKSKLQERGINIEKSALLKFYKVLDKRDF